MKFLIGFASINLITLFFFVVLYIINLKQDTTPKQKAVWATLTGTFLLFYILCDLLMALITILPPHNFFFLFFAIFAIIPFLIGRVVTYETLKKYLFIQIFALILNLLIYIKILFDFI